MRLPLLAPKSTTFKGLDWLPLKPSPGGERLEPLARLDIFANFFIDTPERFLRMQDSFSSFKDISANKWVVNVRGRYIEQTIDFLHLNIGEKLISYKLHSKDGWFHDSRQMLTDINSDYILFWLEDHINISDLKLLHSITKELKENEIDFMMYSFWWDGALRRRYNGIPMNSGLNIDWFNHTVTNNPIVQSNAKEGVYILPACSIFKNALFKRIVSTDDPVQKRWPKETPFDFEKSPTDIHWLPLRVALPRQELFASIDDDHVHPGSCLISRGLYPCREKRHTYAISNLQSNQRQERNIFTKLYRLVFP
jgi:hypothetical protein